MGRVSFFVAIIVLLCLMALRSVRTQAQNQFYGHQVVLDPVEYSELENSFDNSRPSEFRRTNRKRDNPHNMSPAFHDQLRSRFTRSNRWRTGLKPQPESSLNFLEVTH